MKAKYLFGAVLISFASCASATASANVPMQTIDMKSDLCSINAAATEETLAQFKYEDALNIRTISVAEKMLKFMDARKWKSGVPMGEQMNSAEAIQFRDLEAQQKDTTLSSLTESKRTRDIQVLQSMSIIAKQLSDGSYKVPVDKNSQEFILAQLIVLSREEFPISDEMHDKSFQIKGNCNFENSLLSAAWRAVDKKDKWDEINKFVKQSEDLIKKYGKNYDKGQMTEEERRTFDSGEKFAKEFLMMRDLSKDLVFISKLENVSKLQLEARRSSHLLSPGDADYISVVWDQWKIEGKISSEQHNLTRALNYINERIPSEFMNSAQQEN